MANTYELINSISLTSTTAFGSVSFSNIPQTYKDLTLWVSARSDRTAADGLERVYLYMNSGTTGITMINTVVGGSSYYSDTYTTANGVGGTCGLTSNQNAPSGQFGFTMLYISDYTSGTAKVGISSSTMAIGASGTSGYVFGQSYQRTTNSGISSISTSGLGSNWLTGSTFYLYGIK